MKVRGRQYRNKPYCCGQNSLTNSVDPDQTAHKEQSDQSLSCLLFRWQCLTPRMTVCQQLFMISTEIY